MVQTSKTLSPLFLDFQMAYDLVSHSWHWYNLSTRGFPPHPLKVNLQSTGQKAKACCWMAQDLEIKGMAGALELYLALEVARNQASTLMYVSSWVSGVLANVKWYRNLGCI